MDLPVSIGLGQPFPLYVIGVRIVGTHAIAMVELANKETRKILSGAI